MIAFVKDCFIITFFFNFLPVQDCLLRASWKHQLGFNNRPWVIKTLPSTCHHFHSPKVGDDYDTQNTALLLVQKVCFLPQGLLGSTASSTFRPWEFPVQKKKVVNTSATRVKSHAKSVKSQINTPKHTLKSSSTPVWMLPEVTLSPEGGAFGWGRVEEQLSRQKPDDQKQNKKNSHDGDDPSKKEAAPQKKTKNPNESRRRNRTRRRRRFQHQKQHDQSRISSLLVLLEHIRYALESSID